MSDYLVLPGQGWKHTVKIDATNTFTEDVLGWLVVIDGHQPRAIPITRSSLPGEVWARDAGPDIDLPDHVAAALGVDHVEQSENATWTRPTRRWPE